MAKSQCSVEPASSSAAAAADPVAKLRSTEASRFFRWKQRLLGRRNWILLILLALAFALRIGGIHRSIEIDEMHSLDWAKPVGERQFYKKYTAGNWDAYETNLAIYRLSNRLMVFGSDAVVRLPFLMLGLLGVWVAWRLGRHWRWWFFGFWLAACMTAWPFKVFWDLNIRHYGIMIAAWLLTIWAWEAWRSRPSLLRFALAMLVNLLATWTHLVSVVLLVVPCCYVGWQALVWAVDAMRRRRWRSATGRGWLMGGGRVVLMIALLGFVSLLSVTVNRGPAWVRSTVAKVIPAAASATKPVAAAAGPSAEKMAFTVPDPVTYLKTAHKGLWQKGVFWPWAYMDPTIWRSRYVEGSFLVNNSLHAVAFQQSVRLLNALQWTLFLLILLGTVALAFKSPPLVAAAWSVLFSTAMLLWFNEKMHIYGIEPRYHTLGYVTLLLMLSAGLATLCTALLRLGRRLHLRRWVVRGLPVACLLAVLAGVWGSRVVLKDNRDFYLQNWKGLWEWSTRNRSGGAMIVGLGALAPKYYRALDMQAAPDYELGWQHPGINIAFDSVADYNQRDMVLLELLNPRRYLIDYRYGAGAGVHPLPRLAPLLARLPQEKKQIDGSNGNPANRFMCTAYDLGPTVFLTRGHGVFPLMPRLRAPRLLPGVEAIGAPSAWQIDLAVETPGRYRLRLLGDAAGAQVKILRLNGQAIAFTSSTLAQAELPTFDRAFLELPTSATLLRQTADVAWEASLELSQPFLEPQRLELALDREPTGRDWIVALDYERNGFRDLGRHMLLGPPWVRKQNDNWAIGLPLAFAQGAQGNESVQISLVAPAYEEPPAVPSSVNPQTTAGLALNPPPPSPAVAPQRRPEQLVLSQALQVNRAQRVMRPGDVLELGPMQLGPQIWNTVAGRPLELRVAGQAQPLVRLIAERTADGKPNLRLLSMP